MNPLNKEVAEIYQKWLDAVKDIDTNKYSNPYYLGIPDDWNIDDGSQKRILFIGQEGYGGHWNKFDMGEEKDYIKFDDIERLQEVNIKSIAHHIYKQPNISVTLSDAYTYNYKSYRCGSLFNSMKRIARNKDLKGPIACACAWTNIDLVCYNKKVKNKKALSDPDREILHNNPPILLDIIRVIQPTHIVFFSWHNVSLNHEFGNIADQINNAFVDNSKIMVTKISDIPCLLTCFHPSCRTGWSTLTKRNNTISDYIFQNTPTDNIPDNIIIKI